MCSYSVGGTASSVCELSFVVGLLSLLLFLEIIYAFLYDQTHRQMQITKNIFDIQRAGCQLDIKTSVRILNIKNLTLDSSSSGEILCEGNFDILSIKVVVN